MLLLKTIEAQARSALPNESCGLIAGSGSYLAEDCLPLVLGLRTPHSFSTDKEEFNDVGNKILKRGFNIIGTYHSHPYSDSKLSEEDIDGMTFDGVCLIAGLCPKIKFSAFRIKNKYAQELDIVII